MKILYIYRNPHAGFSIGRVFSPIEEEVRKTEKVDAIYLPYPRASVKELLNNIKYVRNYLKENGDYDIIHITGDVYYIALCLPPTKTVVTVHDIGFYTTSKLSIKKILRYLFWMLPLKRVRYVTFISDKSAKEFNEVIKLKKENQTVIYNPVSNDYKYTPKSLNKDNPIILHIGTKSNKNLGGLIKALSDFKCHLLIIGKLSEEQTKQLCNSHIDYSIYYKISDEEILDLYKKCDIVSFPSFYEGFGMPIIEAQSVGRPVVTSDIPPMNTIAGKGAILVNPYKPEDIRQGFEQALNNSDDVIAEGLKNVTQYTPSFIARKYINLYKTICCDSLF